MNSLLEKNPFSLGGKTVLITGASSGIGRSTAIVCSQLGARIVIVGRNRDRLQETFDSLYPCNEAHLQIVFDLAVVNDLNRLVDELPMLDGIVNNAGISNTKLVNFLQEQELQEVINTNTISPIMLTQKVLKAKKVRQGGSIVFTSSIAGVLSGNAGKAAYGASKSAIDGFMKSLAVEVATKGIRCNCVNPGRVHTNLIATGAYSPEFWEQDMATYPLKRYGEPEEIAYSIVFLLSDASKWITGTNLIIDGGKTI